MNNPDLSGIINVYKPVGITSFSVISRLRKLFHIKKIGHCGTLDPFACGVLPVCIGKATRIIPFMEDNSKTYRSVLLFGIKTDTQDVEGEVIGRNLPSVEKLRDLEIDDYIDIRNTISDFTGEIQQIPPMYSAVKVKGKPLYRYAREGITLDRKARSVYIHNIQVERFFLSESEKFSTGQTLHAEITVNCSKGTYIRTLCHDIGEATGFGACAMTLERLSSGIFFKDSAYTLDEIEKNYENGQIGNILLPESSAIGHIPSLALTNEEARRLSCGQRLPFSDVRDRILTLFENNDFNNKLIAGYSGENLVVMIKLEIEENVVLLKIERVFV